MSAIEFITTNKEAMQLALEIDMLDSAYCLNKDQEVKEKIAVIRDRKSDELIQLYKSSQPC